MASLRRQVALRAGPNQGESVTDEREELERIVKVVTTQRNPFMTAAYAYGDARERKGHVAACILRDWAALPQGKRELTQSEVEDLLPKCGQGGWHCDRAPIKEGS